MITIKEHFEEALQYFPYDNIVGIFLQGSQNYKLDTINSDTDTKLIVTPTLNDLVMNKKPVSTTHIRANDEHIDFKDIRLYIDTFRKQNLNFLEILFTDYYILNDFYAVEWNRLRYRAEDIAHYNPFRSVKSMKGVALEKYHAMEHQYPSKIEILKKYGYDPKQLHHLLRIKDFISRYIDGEPYSDCMIPIDKEYLIDVKQGLYTLEEARPLADKALEEVTNIADKYCSVTPDTYNEGVEELLVEVQTAIMTKSIRNEIEIS